MEIFADRYSRQIRLTDERLKHIKNDHPEMYGELEKIKETLLIPDKIIKSKTDSEVELFYRYYEITPVTKKYLCVIVKVINLDLFVITSYFTDTIKRGNILWEKK